MMYRYNRIVFATIVLVLFAMVAYQAIQPTSEAIAAPTLQSESSLYPQIRRIRLRKEYRAERTRRVHAHLALAPQLTEEGKASFQINLSHIIPITSVLEEASISLHRGNEVWGPYRLAQVQKVPTDSFREVSVDPEAILFSVVVQAEANPVNDMEVDPRVHVESAIYRMAARLLLFPTVVVALKSMS